MSCSDCSALHGVNPYLKKTKLCFHRYIVMCVFLVFRGPEPLKTSFPNVFPQWPFSRESFKLWIQQIYMTSNIFLKLMMSFLIFPWCDYFRQAGVVFNLGNYFVGFLFFVDYKKIKKKVDIWMNNVNISFYWNRINDWDFVFF